MMKVLMKIFLQAAPRLAFAAALMTALPPSLRAQFGAPSDLTWGGSTLSLLPLGSLLLWLKADYLMTLAPTNAIATWFDASGLGNNATQSATNNRPLYMTNQINGLPAVGFNATNALFLDLPQMFTNETSAEVFVVVKLNNDPPTGSRYGQWRFAGTGDINAFPFTDGVILDGFCSTLRKSTANPSLALTSWRLYDVTSIDNAWTNRVDAVVLFGTASNTFTNGTGSTMGTARRLGQSGSSSVYLNGSIAEVLLYGRILSGAERTNVQNYITARYGLTL